MWESGKSGTEKSQTNHELGISISSPYPRFPEFHIQILAGPWHSPEEQYKLRKKERTQKIKMTRNSAEELNYSFRSALRHLRLFAAKNPWFDARSA